MTNTTQNNPNDGDCQSCSGTGATYSKDDNNQWSVSGDCQDCDGTGDAKSSGGSDAKG